MSQNIKDLFIGDLSKKLADEGFIIEAGWEGLKLLSLPPDASQQQVDDMRIAFFAGAQHLYSSILYFVEEGIEPTEKDLLRMQKVHAELETFINTFVKEREIMKMKTQGSA